MATATVKAESQRQARVQRRARPRVSEASHLQGRSRRRRLCVAALLHRPVDEDTTTVGRRRSSA